MKAYPQFKWMPIEEQYAPMGGMDLRDYFAAKSLVLADKVLYDNESFEEMAMFAYSLADAMLEARTKDTKDFKTPMRIYDDK